MLEDAEPRFLSRLYGGERYQSGYYLPLDFLSRLYGGELKIHVLPPGLVF